MQPEHDNDSPAPGPAPRVEAISAVSLATHDMARAVRLYQALGFTPRYGGEDSSFTSLSVGSGYVNLIAQPPGRHWSWWGRVIFYVSDVDGLYERALALGLHPDGAPRDAPWGERYFHLTDPDGHELSFAMPLRGLGPRAQT
jgi:catechol 2,3-dioxygenase-like lactoylglutathione lyase family enzyme